MVELARAGEPAAVRLVRDSGRLIGEVLAAAVNLFNPAVIVIGGDVAQAHEQLLAGIREVVYQRSLPLATRHLRIVRSQLADRAGVIGAAVMVIEHVLSPGAVDAAIATMAPDKPAGQRPDLSGQREERNRREVRSGSGDHEHVEDLVIAEDGGAGVRATDRIDDRADDVESAAAGIRIPAPTPVSAMIAGKPIAPISPTAT